MSDAIQELKLVLSLDTKAYQAGLKGAKASLLGLTSAQVAFGMAAAQYAMKGIDAVVRQYKEYDQELDRLSYLVTDYNKVSKAMLQANTQTTASLRTVGAATAAFGSRLSISAGNLAELAAVTSQYAEDTGDSAGAASDAVTDLANKWGRASFDEVGGIESALARAGQMTGQLISTLGAQMMDATPFAKALGMEFEELLAQAVVFKKTGVDFGLYISLMEKNFEKFGGNAAEANREISLISNTVRGFKTQAEAVGFLIEQGFSSRAAIELAEALRSQTQVELDEAEKEIRAVSDSLDDLAKDVEDNINFWDRLGMAIKGAWNILMNPLAIPAFSDKQLKSLLNTAGYADDEAKKILENLEVYDNLMNDSKMRDQLAPGKIMKFDFTKYKAPEKKSEVFTMPYVNNAYGEGGQEQTAEWTLPKVQGIGQMAMGGIASDIDFGAKAVADMYRVEDTANIVTKQIKGSFREAFVSAADYADSSSATMRSSLVPAIDGAAAGVEEMAVATEQAQQGVSELNQVSEDTRSTWEQVADWAKQAADKMGIDPEILSNNIWTGLARVGKESLIALGVDVDGLTAKVQDFFVKAKGYGLDINQFWEWAQKGTGQTTKEIWDQTLDQMAKATGNFIMQASAMFATGTVDWKELFGGLWRSILASTVTAVAKMVADWIMGLEIIAQAKAWLETIPGVTAALLIGGLAVGAVSLLAATAGKNQTAMASGGLVTGPTHALIGEAGPEAVFPLEKLRDFGIPYGRGSAPSVGSGNSGPVINITVNNPVLNNRTSEKDVREFMDRMGRQMVRKGGALANSYS